eukprot:scaffold4522_cov130-Amphora_coffeaeformis.AAC.6
MQRADRAKDDEKLCVVFLFFGLSHPFSLSAAGLASGATARRRDDPTALHTTVPVTRSCQDRL